MSTRDLVNIGVFSALYFVILFAAGMLGVFNPAMMFAGYALGILANGVTLALFRARVRKVGAMTVLAIICGLLMTLTGHGWYMALVSGLLGLAGDLIASRGNFTDPRLNTLAYALMSLWYVAPWFPMVINKDAYYDYVAGSMGTEYADALTWFFSPTMLAIWAVCVFLLGLIGGAFGQRLIAKHFAKAGLAR